MIYGALHLAARHPARHRQSFPIRWYEKKGALRPRLDTNVCRKAASGRLSAFTVLYDSFTSSFTDTLWMAFTTAHVPRAIQTGSRHILTSIPAAEFETEILQAPIPLHKV